jgi:hypothetical protein
MVVKNVSLQIGRSIEVGRETEMWGERKRKIFSSADVLGNKN